MSGRAAAVCLIATLPAGAAWAQQSTHSLTIGAAIGKKTSLHVSSSVLDVAPMAGGGTVVVGTVEFQGGARTSRGGEVILTVEALRDVETLAGGASGGGVVIEFAGTEDGAVPGVLSTTPQVAGRWVGSGARRGRLVFTLRGAGYITGGVIPLRFVLSAP